MKSHTIAFALIIGLVIVDANLGVASDYLIEKKALLGCQVDTDSLPEIEVVALKKIDSMKVVETLNKFECFPEIWGRQFFARIPCLKSYYLWACLDVNDMPKDVYRMILFNVCDSSVYHFGGDLATFSQVMRLYLQQDLLAKEVLEVLEFYLNTLSIENPYYIVGSGDDFQRVYDEHSTGDLEKDTTFYKIWEWQRDKNLVDRFVHPPKAKKLRGGFEIEFYSWEYYDGNIEYWRFKVVAGNVELVKHAVLMERVGPRRPL